MVALSPFGRWVKTALSLGLLSKICTGHCRGPSVTLPLAVRLVTLLIASMPPTACTYLARIWSTLGRLAGGWSSSKPCGRGGVASALIAGIAIGLGEPR